MTFSNSLHPNISFTIEIQNNGYIPLLDLGIQRNDSLLSFSSYFESNHPISPMLACFHSLFHSFWNIPLTHNMTFFFK